MKKIVIIGPESTGKSTLCQQLAAHFNTLWCAEYAREFLEKNGMQYTYDDLLVIAKGQLQLEDAVTAQARQLCFIDTNMYVMQVWCEFVFGKCHQWIIDQIVERPYDLYLLCNTDLPWTSDPLREYPDEGRRNELYHMYRELMISQSVPWVEISGTDEERLQTAIAAVNRFI